MPALDSLQRELAGPDFQFLTINEDVNAADARSFVEDFGFTFPVLLGEAKMKARIHYLGLPFTVLLDRLGRVAHQWIGFAGPGQIRAIRSLVLTELRQDTAALPSGVERTH